MTKNRAIPPIHRPFSFASSSRRGEFSDAARTRTVGSGSIVNEVERTYNTFVKLANEYQEQFGAVDTVGAEKGSFWNR
jgi:hypothetical protein